MNALFWTPDGHLRPMLRLAIFVALFLLALIAIGLITRIAGLPRFVSEDMAQPFPQLILGLLVLGAVLGVLAIQFRGIEKRPFSTVGLPLSSPWLKSVVVGLGIGAFNISLFVIIMYLAGNAEISRANISVVDILKQTLPICIALAAFSGWEEIALRGYGLQMLSEAFGYRAAIIITGLAFGFMHAGNPGSNFQGLLYTGLGGILLGWLVIRTGSLWLVWGYHAGWNITSALFYGLKVSGIVHPGFFFQTQIMGADWLTGGNYGFEGSVLIAGIEIISLTVIVALASHLPGHRHLIEYFTGNTESEQNAGN